MLAAKGLRAHPPSSFCHSPYFLPLKIRTLFHIYIAWPPQSRAANAFRTSAISFYLSRHPDFSFYLPLFHVDVGGSCFFNFVGLSWEVEICMCMSEASPGLLRVGGSNNPKGMLIPLFVIPPFHPNHHSCLPFTKQNQYTYRSTLYQYANSELSHEAQPSLWVVVVVYYQMGQRPRR